MRNKTTHYHIRNLLWLCSISCIGSIMSNCHLLVQDNVLQNYIFKQSFGAVTLLIDNILQTALFTLLNVFKISFICSSILRRGILHWRQLMVSLVFMEYSCPKNYGEQNRDQQYNENKFRETRNTNNKHSQLC